MGTMTLKDAIGSLDEFEESATLYAAKPWNKASETVVANEGEEEANNALERGLSYLLEVSIAKEVLEVWSEWRGGRVPSGEERCGAVIHYALNDAYLQT
jgi:hypothetical protein